VWNIIGFSHITTTAAGTRRLVRFERFDCTWINIIYSNICIKRMIRRRTRGYAFETFVQNGPSRSFFITRISRGYAAGRRSPFGGYSIFAYRADYWRLPRNRVREPHLYWYRSRVVIIRHTRYIIIVLNWRKCRLIPLVGSPKIRCVSRRICYCRTLVYIYIFFFSIIFIAHTRAEVKCFQSNIECTRVK